MIPGHVSATKELCCRSSLIQTILSAPESHRIMPVGSRAVPPVGNLTLPRRQTINIFMRIQTDRKLTL